MRNTTHVKRYEETLQNPEETSPLPDVTDPVKPEAERVILSSLAMTRPKRVRKLPKKFNDFVMT